MQNAVRAVAIFAFSTIVANGTFGVSGVIIVTVFVCTLEIIGQTLTTGILRTIVTLRP